MPPLLRTWWKKQDAPGRQRTGVNVTRDAVEFWRDDPGNVAVCVSLNQFHVEGVKSDRERLSGWVGREQAPEVIQFVADLMEAHRDYVD